VVYGDFRRRPRRINRHLLNHSSGLPDNMPEVVGWMHLDDEPRFDQTALLKEVFPVLFTLTKCFLTPRSVPTRKSASRTFCCVSSMS
jgi:hypothetical protein